MVRILIVDSHPIVRRGIVAVLAGELTDLEIIEAATPSEALHIVANQVLSLALIDFSFRSGKGMDVLKQIRAANPILPVLIFSSYLETAEAARALRAGAAAYVGKDSAPEILVEAVRHALAGRRFVPPSIAEDLTDALATNAFKPPHESLSDREYEVMLRISAGVSISEVAEDLCLSPKTVSTYRVRILDKMRMKTNAQLTEYVILNNLTDHR